MTDEFVITEIVPAGADVQWLCIVEHPGIVGTASAVLSSRDVRFNDGPSLERLKEIRIQDAKRTLLERGS